MTAKTGDITNEKNSAPKATKHVAKKIIPNR
jgi:hypothetical protein